MLRDERQLNPVVGSVIVAFQYIVITYALDYLLYLYEIRVLLANVGPKLFINLSDICRKSVRKLSFTKNCQKTV